MSWNSVHAQSKTYQKFDTNNHRDSGKKKMGYELLNFFTKDNLTKLAVYTAAITSSHVLIYS